jgi:ribosomal protein S12 methylthiotransferase accessory factor YcaO
MMPDTGCYSPHRCSERMGGAGITRDEALAATIGEAIERYCSNARIDPEGAVRRTAANAILGEIT